MNMYYFATLIAILILGTTFLITSWGFIVAKVRGFLKRLGKRLYPINGYIKDKQTSKVEIRSSDRDGLRRKK